MNTITAKGTMISRPASRVAVIGAGPCGLFLLRSFALAEKSGIQIPEIVCFEKQGDWGGLWNYTWRTGVDEHGDPVHSSLYRHLWANVPKEYCEFSDYTYDQHFSKPVPSYLTSEETLSYIIGRIKDVNIRRFIQFNTAVRHVAFDPVQDKFTIRVEDFEKGTSRLEHFDNVVVAVGHYYAPNAPQFEGMNDFPGRIVHSHDFRNAREYAGQNVLIIGGSHSAEDIALQLYKFGSRSITISCKKTVFQLKWPQEIQVVPLLSKVEGKTAHFKDGSQRDVDSIVLCTGYRHHFPFMDENLRLFTRNLLYPENLYKGIFFQSEPRVSYLGMHNFFFSFVGLNVQAWYVRDVLLGNISLPGAEERAIDMADWQTQELRVNGFMGAVEFVKGALKNLLASIKGYPLVDFESSISAIKIMVRNKEDNIIEYRNQIFTSHYTGTEAAKLSVPWIDAEKDY